MSTFCNSIRERKIHQRRRNAADLVGIPSINTSQPQRRVDRLLYILRIHDTVVSQIVDRYRPQRFPDHHPHIRHIASKIAVQIARKRRNRKTFAARDAQHRTA